MNRKDLRKRVLDNVARLEPEILRWSDYLYRNPELGNEEFKAVAFLREVLEEHSFEFQGQVAGLPTAFVARSGEGEPRVAFLAEYDALPEIGHGCGHNFIAASSVGAACALAPLLSELGGEVRVYGTPAEETSGAKVVMARAGLFRDVDAVMIVHPAGETAVGRSSLAMDCVEFIFHGKAAHAASAPHEGINALDGVIQTFNAINALRQHVRDDVRIHGIITNGGVAPNIVPELASARFYVRAAKRSYLNTVVEKVVNCARGAALATGTRLEISHPELSYDELITNDRLAAAFAANLRSLGVELDEPEKGVGSTDVGNVSHVAPTIHPYIAVGPSTLVAHTEEFREAVVSDAGKRALIVATQALALTGLEILTDPDLLQEIRAEFRGRV